ncbi:WhiB family transcriptional regulator [Nocardiopsis algeriensis]|uniref:Transcriptional regulator WhiB n=1 Tax=Nocardiopsis algeriensis TaxID=1478215 RepID=A0A841ITQ6_9ACTN|nr:WhiB family transcriptional regulator [Nocardiopsis algeriensis]MBB6122067.1 WhiB family redox-sensing transcriptional regulator [Nocardiopsis algeriensis]
MRTYQWTTRARCRRVDPDALFVQGAAQNRAKLICRDCPVRVQCLADALDNRVEFGVWGGTTERERRALLRKHPGVDSWAPLLEEVVREGDEDLARELDRHAADHGKRAA